MKIKTQKPGPGKHTTLVQAYGKALALLNQHGPESARDYLLALAARNQQLALSQADLLLGLAAQVSARNPAAALVLLGPALLEQPAHIGTLRLAASLQDRTGDRKAAKQSALRVIESDQALPGQVMDACNLLVRLEDNERALIAAKAAYEKMGRPLNWTASLLYIALKAADWTCVKALTRELQAAYAQGQVTEARESPRTHLLWCDDLATNIDVVKAWSVRHFPKPSNLALQVQPLQGRRLRVGYLSSDFRDHPTARLINGLLRHHDRTQFELFMYCSGWDDHSVMRREIVSHFDHVCTVTHLDDEAAAQLIRSHQIDVLLELNGPTRAHRMGILAYRPAPVQIDYLGWPGSVGGRIVDYVVGDSCTVPNGEEALYPEKLIRLQKIYQVNDYASQTLAAPPPRESLRLPPDVKVLGMFNAINKVRSEVWAIWMQILKAVPESVLWLLDPGVVARKYIGNWTKALGVDPRRIIIAARLPQDAHLARLQHCDLMLDPWPYGGHTSTSDALFAGVPVLTLEGKNFAGRVSGGLLKAAGLAALVQPDTETYARVAIRLLREPEELERLKRFVREKVPGSDLFNAKAKARQFELAYRQAFELAVSGQAPQHLPAAKPAAHRSGPTVAVASKKLAIPRLIHQTYRSDDVPPAFVAGVEQLRHLNPGWEYRFYSDRQAAKFIFDTYGSGILKAWERLNPAYGAARADLFRYLLIHELGGLYLDIKSSVTKPLDAVLQPDDRYLLSHWNNRPGDRYQGWGLHPELSNFPQGEFQQWFVLAAPRHPFLAAVIKRVLRQIEEYSQNRNGVGKAAVVRLTGPVAYTQAIAPLLPLHPYRLVDAERDLGLVYSVASQQGTRAHEKHFEGHYSTLRESLVLPAEKSCISLSAGNDAAGPAEPSSLETVKATSSASFRAVQGEERILLVSPQGGLGNRLRVIASAMVLAKQTGRSLCHAWTASTPTDTRRFVADQQKLGLLSLFEEQGAPVEVTPASLPRVDICFSEWLPGDAWYSVQSSAQQRWGIAPDGIRYSRHPDDLAAAVARSKLPVVLVETSESLRLPAALGGVASDAEWHRALHMAYASLRPHRRFLDLVDASEAADIGIRLRHGDLQHYFPASRQDVIALTAWCTTLATRYRVSVDSDHPALKEKVLRSIEAAGGSVIQPFAAGSEARPDWERVFLDFLYLARRTALVCGTPDSSYSFEAASFGMRPYLNNLSPLGSIDSLLGGRGGHSAASNGKNSIADRLGACAGGSDAESFEPIPYQIDFPGQSMIYAMGIDPQHASQAVFHRNFLAEKAVHWQSIPWDERYAIGSMAPDMPDPIFIFSPGRCGSTLLARLLMAMGVATISEPGLYGQIGQYKSDKPLPENFKKLLRLVSQDLCMPLMKHGQAPVAIKLQSQANINPGVVLSVCRRRPKTIFIARDFAPWAKSMVLAFDTKLEKLQGIYEQSRSAMQYLQVHSDCLLVRYEDLLPEEGFLQILSRHLNRNQQLDLTEIVKCFSEDSQFGTNISRSILSSRRLTKEAEAYIDRVSMSMPLLMPDGVSCCE